jgi:hypothetical protein
MTTSPELAAFNKAVSHWSNQFAPELRKTSYTVGSRMGWDHEAFQISLSSLQRHYAKDHGETISKPTLIKHLQIWADQGGLKVTEGYYLDNGPQLQKDDPNRLGKDGKRVGARGGKRYSTAASNVYTVDFSQIVKSRNVMTGQKGKPAKEYWVEPWNFGDVAPTKSDINVNHQLTINCPSVDTY